METDIQDSDTMQLFNPMSRFLHVSYYNQYEFSLYVRMYKKYVG